MRAPWIVCLILLATSGFGQVRGRVTDENGEPLSALLYAEGTGKATNANAAGYYELTLKPGDYSLAAFLSGYAVARQPMQYQGGREVVNFTLTALTTQLESVTVKGTREEDLGIAWMQSVEGAAIYEGKKSELIPVNALVGNLAANTGRQVYARVPGLNIFENDGVGLQLAIGARGLDPNRTSNFNVRQNGYDISADALGYPESYYTPPVQALQRIEIVRGAAGLQYGSQFGGLLNFRFKEGSEDKKIALDVSQTGGSFGLFNSFNSLGGTVGKTNYYGFYQYKRSGGWRPNSLLAQHTAFGSVKYSFNPFLSLKLDITHMNYTAQQPGGLTDAQFAQDPLQSTRARNWFRVGWNIAALEWDYRLNSQLKLNNRTFLLRASRYAVGNLERIDRPDDLTQARNLIKDDFNNWGNELRAILHYHFIKRPSVLLVGNRYYEGFSLSAQGTGSVRSDADFGFANPERPDHSEYQFPSRNIAFFAENIFTLSPDFSLTPGIRYEYILTRADGYYLNQLTDQAGNIILSDTVDENRRDARDILLLGLGASYRASESTEFYANFSQNYRSINFTDIRIDLPFLVVDPDISDEAGFNVDGGVRGEEQDRYLYDVSAFALAYRNRIGNTLTTINGQPRTLRTNIGDAYILGLEAYGELNLSKQLGLNERVGTLKSLVNLALIYSQYTRANEAAATLGELIKGNQVELVPPVNVKFGLNYRLKSFKSSLLYTYVARQFSDAANTKPATFSAIQGPIPAYSVVDFSSSYSWKVFSLDAGVNNLLNTAYFTRRASGYPGPGIIPAPPRSYYITLRFQY